jgi:hypothetical protein
MKAAIASLAVIAAVAVAWSAAPAQNPVHDAVQNNDKIKRIIVYGADPCPRGEGDQIVICGRRPEKDRYRVPKAMRNTPSTDPENTSWANKSRSMEYVGATGTQSCSTVGPGGSTGCWKQLMNTAHKEHEQPQ